jgi:hypothetical protein
MVEMRVWFDVKVGWPKSEEYAIVLLCFDRDRVVVTFEELLLFSRVGAIPL